MRKTKEQLLDLFTEAWHKDLVQAWVYHPSLLRLIYENIERTDWKDVDAMYEAALLLLEFRAREMTVGELVERVISLNRG